MKSIVCLYLVLMSAFATAQVTYEEYEVIEEKQYAIPRVAGGKPVVDQVLKTQFEIPKSVLSSDYKQELITYFTITKEGKLTNLTFDKKYNNFLENEVKRFFKFFTFLPHEEKGKGFVDMECAFRLKLSAESNKKFQKFKGKTPVKSSLPKDTSFVVYERADVSPEYYKNGEEGLKAYILSEILYPSVAERNNIEGTVVLEFIVEANGYPTNIIVKKGVNGGCTEEAVRLISETKWQPAQKDGKLVRYKLTYPIGFSLQNVNRDNSSGNQGQQ